MSSQSPSQWRARHQVSLPYSSRTRTALPPPPFPTRSALSIPTDSHSEDSLTTENHACHWTGKANRGRDKVTPIDVLPDDVLLEIFDFCTDEDQFATEAWKLLIHVCRRWRSVVFGSPRRLNLRLVCTAKTPARAALDVWPALPLLIQEGTRLTAEGADNIVAVLERRDRVDKIYLFDITSSSFEKVLAAMQQPFPELTYLVLWSNDETLPILPESFLGGSAPRLQFLRLDGIPFPGLPKLLLSATHLDTLYLRGIPHSGYLSPEAISTALSALTSLRSLCFEFRSPGFRFDQESQRPPPGPLIRFVIPVLTLVRYKGAREYLDDLMAYIDAPRLERLYITFFNQVIFNTPQFIQFISRTPRLKALEQARVVFDVGAAMVKISSRSSGWNYYVHLPPWRMST